MHSLCRYRDYVILREVAGSMQRLDCSDFATHCNDESARWYARENENRSNCSYCARKSQKTS